MEPLYTVAPDGKTLKPWLATSYKVSNDGKTYTFTLRQGVKFSNGQPMTSADVKFSIDDARAQTKGWGYLDAAIKNITAPNPNTVVFHLKYKWAPFLADIALFANGIIPNNFAGQTRKAFYKHPIGTGPFMWDKRVVGQSVTFKRNPNYWQKGKPYLDSVTWTYVTDENTRELQLRGGQIQVDEFPPFNSITKLQNTNGVTMTLFPSTRTDYLEMNEKYAPLADVHVRRAISYAIDRKRDRQVGAVRPRHAGELVPAAAGAVLRPELGRPAVRHGEGEGRAREVEVPEGLQGVDAASAPATQVETAIGQILQSQLKQLGIDVTFKQAGHDHRVPRHPEAQVPARLQLLDDGHRRPGRARHVRGRPGGRSALVLHRLQQPDGDQALAPGAARDELGQAGQALREDPEDRGPGRVPWASSTTRRSAMRTRASCTASSSTRSATTTWRTPGSASDLSSARKRGRG